MGRLPTNWAQRSMQEGPITGHRPGHTHTQLPGAFSLAVPALHQLSEDMEGGRWAEDNRPMSRAQSIQNT